MQSNSGSRKWPQPNGAQTVERMYYRNFWGAALEKVLKVHAAGGATLKTFALWFWDSRGAKV